MKGLKSRWRRELGIKTINPLTGQQHNSEMQAGIGDVKSTKPYSVSSNPSSKDDDNDGLSFGNVTKCSGSLMKLSQRPGIFYHPLSLTNRKFEPKSAGIELKRFNDMEVTLWESSRDAQRPESVEKLIRDMVVGLTGVERLERAMGVLGHAPDANDRALDVAAEVWDLILREEWWRALYGSVKEFTEDSGFPETLATVPKRRDDCRKLKRKYAASAARGGFAASIEMRGISALGDALVGARRWDSSAVLTERDVVLGTDDGVLGYAILQDLSAVSIKTSI